MNFDEYLSAIRDKVSSNTFKLLNDFRINVGGQFVLLDHIIEEFISLSDGGKYIRGCLVKLGYEMYLNEQIENEDILNAASAFEIFHTAVLIHDDVIDKGKKRRGLPTFHLSLSEKVKSLTDFDRDVDTAHYGVSQAICIGDIGIFLSYKLINQTDFDDDVKNRAHIFFTDILLMTCLGQMADVELPYYKKSNKNFEKEIMEICENKTAHYTITGPLLLGAILAGLTNKKELEKIKYFGKNLGIAFQIKDDVLGVFGSETEIGKSNTSDIDEGKMTLLYWYTLESDIKSEEKEYLKSHYGIGKLQTEDYNKIKNLITISGAKERVQMKETFYCNQAIECIRDFNISEKNKSFLLDFVHLLIKRNK